jgi:5-methyltetrahydrofolate--homocysteine methyltransferase
MSRPRLLAALDERVLIGDGAMGTQLQLAGLEPGGCGEAWNIDYPERVIAIQRAYVDAGADCLLTNTFGASRIMLERHGEGDRVVAINRAAVDVARRAFGDRRGFVIGDVGPFGGLMEPFGDIEPSRVARAFREQARALVEAGVDAIIIETQTALEELEIAVAAAREEGAEVVIGSIAYDLMQDGIEVRTMMGVSPEGGAQFMVERGVDILGLNCGTLIDMAIAADIVRRYRSVSPLPVMAQPNAGQPVLENFQVVYKQTPEEMAGGVLDVVRAGARIVGGCCGSTPAHIRRLREAVLGRSAVESR